MPKVDRIMFDHKELAEALIVKQDIHEGLWGISVEFGLAVANVPTGPERSFLPASINLVQKIGIQRFPEANNLTVDATEVNPAPRKSIMKKPKRSLKAKK